MTSSPPTRPASHGSSVGKRRTGWPGGREKVGQWTDLKDPHKASNTNRWHWRETRIRLAAAGLRTDTPVVLSHELGVCKPDPAFYAALRELVPAICVFVDDLVENVTAARAAGIHAHHHDDPRQSAGILQPFAEAWSAGEET